MNNVVELTPPVSRYARAVEAIAGWLKPGRLKVYPTAITALTFAAWGVSQALGPGLTDVSRIIVGADFAEFYTAGRFFLDGRLAALYDFSAQQAFQAGLVAPVTTSSFTAFVYPPFTVVLFALFAWDGYVAGLLLWWGAGLLALGIALHLFRQEWLRDRAPSLRRLFWTSFLFYPTLAWFLYGQNTALTLLLYTLTIVGLRRGRDLAAGVSLGLLLYKPQLAMALCLVLLVQRRWRALVGGALGAGLWLAVGFWLSPRAMGEFMRLAPSLPELERSLLIHHWGLSSFFGFATLLLDGWQRQSADLLAAALTVGGLITMIAWWRRARWAPGTPAWDWRLAATMALGLLISPHLFLYDLMLLLLPLGIVWSYYPAGTEGRPLDRGPLLAWTAALYVATFAGSYFSAAQQQLSVRLGLPEMAFQISTPIIVGWAWLVARQSRASVGARLALAQDARLALAQDDEDD